MSLAATFLGPLELVDQSVDGEVTMPGEGDDVGVVAVGVRVAGDIGRGALDD